MVTAAGPFLNNLAVLRPALLVSRQNYEEISSKIGRNPSHLTILASTFKVACCQWRGVRLRDTNR